MIRLKEGECLNGEQKAKFKNTLIEMYGKKKCKSKKSMNKKSVQAKTPKYKIAKAFKNLG